MTIQKFQVDKLEVAQEASFIFRLGCYLLESYPEQFSQLSQIERDDLVKGYVLRARKYKLETEFDICLYSEIEVLHGSDFSSNPDTSCLADMLNSPTDPFNGFEPVVEANKLAKKLPQKPNTKEFDND